MISELRGWFSNATDEVLNTVFIYSCFGLEEALPLIAS